MEQLNYLKQKMIPIVNQCLKIHGGGESYFDELDGLIKNDIELMVTYLKYAVEKEKIENVVVSGEIGLILSKLISKKIIPMDVNLICLNGGLRKGEEPVGTIPRYQSFKAIFFDDSYYSGKTAMAVHDYIHKCGGTIVKNYVFYDGCLKKHDDVDSLYRYYKQAEISVSCEEVGGENVNFDD